MKNILICFGGVTAEHEVSIITGLQVFEQIDRTKFTPYALYVTQNSEYYLMSGLTSRYDFLKAKRVVIKFGKDERGGFIQTDGLLSKKIYPDCAYFAFHGGTGESGQLQGLFESFSIAHTGPTVESAVLCMNKALTKDILAQAGINTIPGVVVSSREVNQKTKLSIKLPVIVKPVHLGSSIGVTVADNAVSLKKALLAASQVDSEIVIEQFMKNFVEYNCAVRTKGGKLEASEVERPIKNDEILSFSDKYEKGGGKKSGGMASLVRELPAKIPASLRSAIQDTAKEVYSVLRTDGMIRCDFMVVNKKLYLIEVNPIPGSMAFYLWEASGISFKDQITDSIEEAVIAREKHEANKLVYKTDIVEKFVTMQG